MDALGRYQPDGVFHDRDAVYQHTGCGSFGKQKAGSGPILMLIYPDDFRLAGHP